MNIDNSAKFIKQVAQTHQGLIVDDCTCWFNRFLGCLCRLDLFMLAVLEINIWLLRSRCADFLCYVLLKLCHEHVLYKNITIFIKHVYDLLKNNRSEAEIIKMEILTACGQEKDVHFCRACWIKSLSIFPFFHFIVADFDLFLLCMFNKFLKDLIIISTIFKILITETFELLASIDLLSTRLKLAMHV